MAKDEWQEDNNSELSARLISQICNNFNISLINLQTLNQNQIHEKQIPVPNILQA